MRVSINATEPEILRDAQAGDLFLVHTPELCECVAALAYFKVDEHDEPLKIEGPDRIEIVVIGCRLSPGEPGFWHAGVVHRVHLDTPITRLDQSAPLRLQGRRQLLPDLRTHVGELVLPAESFPRFFSGKSIPLRATRHAKHKVPLSEL